jgi:hypothetical protein
LLSIIDDLGYASSKAQNLKAPITSIQKLKNNPNQRIYILREESIARPKLRSQTSREDLYMFSAGGISGFKDIANAGKHVVTGFVKVGVKTLFLLVSIK